MEYDSILNNVASTIQNSISVLRSRNFITKCTKTLNANGREFELNSKNVPEISTSPGIYLFWADFSEWKNNHSWDDIFSLFLDEWSNPIEEIKYYPNFNKKRAAKTFKEYEKGDWLPFYLGKAKNINKRVQQHMTLGGNKKTYALKLNAMSENLTGIKFTVNELPFSLTAENYFLLELIESELRNHLNPIIGKQ